jgi:hypothetical protein
MNPDLFVVFKTIFLLNLTINLMGLKTFEDQENHWFRQLA